MPTWAPMYFLFPRSFLLLSALCSASLSAGSPSFSPSKASSVFLFLAALFFGPMLTERKLGVTPRNFQMCVFLFVISDFYNICVRQGCYIQDTHGGAKLACQKFMRVKMRLFFYMHPIRQEPASHSASTQLPQAGHWRRFMLSSKMAARQPTDSTALWNLNSSAH